MILLAHLLFGALIGQKIANPFLAVLLAFLGHYLLDLFPHVEYKIDNIQKKQWKKAINEFESVLIDFLSGIILILLFSKNYPIIYICAFFAVLPDGISFMTLIFSNKHLEKFTVLHQDKIHFLRNKKISNFWRISSQVLVVLVSIFLLKL